MSVTGTHARHRPATVPRHEADVLEIILDRPDLTALIRAGSHPAALPCGRCGTSQGRHRQTSSCSQFVRPALPPGYAYADQLVVGQRFRFVPMTDPPCIRQVEDLTCCAGSLTIIRSQADNCQSATHWVEGSLVVATPGRPDEVLPVDHRIAEYHLNFTTAQKTIEHTYVTQESS